MNKYIKIVFLIILVTKSIMTFADSNLALLDVASTQYTDGQFEEAILTYTQILDNEYESSELYYNLGNCHYKLSELAFAILYYEKADLLAPNDEDIDFNLELARSHTVDKLDVIPEFFLSSWYNRLSTILLTNTWAVISMISFGISLLIFLLYIFTSSTIIKKLSFYSATLLLLVSLSSFIISSKESSKLMNRNTAIIFSPSVTIKSSPVESGTDLFLLHEGTKVTIIDSVSTWFEIKLIDGNEGFIQKESLKII